MVTWDSFSTGLVKISFCQEGFCSAPSISDTQPLYWKVTNPTLSPSHLRGQYLVFHCLYNWLREKKKCFLVFYDLMNSLIIFDACMWGNNMLDYLEWSLFTKSDCSGLCLVVAWRFLVYSVMGFLIKSKCYWFCCLRGRRQRKKKRE